MNGISSVKNYEYSFLVRKKKQKLKIKKWGEKSVLAPPFIHTINKFTICFSPISEFFQNVPHIVFGKKIPQNFV